MEKNQTIGVVAVVVVAIVVIAAAAVFMTSDKDEESNPNYWIYFDNVGESGWYTSAEKNTTDAVVDAAKQAGVEFKVDQWGMLSADGYEWITTSDSTGKGLGIYEYGSSDVANPWSGYFCRGPAVSDIVSNIIYITYSDCSWDESYTYTYEGEPAATESAWSIAGPFAKDSGYKAEEVKGPYYIYITGFDVDGQGWQEIKGNSLEDAVVEAGKKIGINFSYNANGMLIAEGFEPEYGEVNTGICMFEYMSKISAYNSHSYYFAGPTVKNCVSNILFIGWGTYTMDPVTYDVTYDVVPSNFEETIIGGPFAA